MGVHATWKAARFIAAILAAGSAAGCMDKDVGYVEIRTVPVASATNASLYLNSVKLDPLKNGSAVLRESVGTSRLATDGASSGGRAPLCEIIVRKNRITTVTVSVLEHPPRCACRTNNPAGSAGARSCIG